MPYHDGSVVVVLLYFNALTIKGLKIILSSGQINFRAQRQISVDTFINILRKNCLFQEDEEKITC